MWHSSIFIHMQLLTVPEVVLFAQAPAYRSLIHLQVLQWEHLKLLTSIRVSFHCIIQAWYWVQYFVFFGSQYSLITIMICSLVQEYFKDVFKIPNTWALCCPIFLHPHHHACRGGTLCVGLFILRRPQALLPQGLSLSTLLSLKFFVLIYTN